MLVALATFAAAAALIVLLPGPDTLVVLRALLRDGRGRAVQAVAGVLCGLSVWVCAAALGLSALLRASHAGYVGLKIAGACYLIWLGVQSLRMRRMAQADHGEHAEPIGKPRRQLLGLGFLAGLASDLLNPKVGVFFVTFLPGFVPHGQSIAATSLLFGAVFVAETAMYFAVLLTVATPVTRWMSSSRVRRRMDVGTGVVLIGLGVRLAVEP
jgi:threonine/homoserine/homoserine lactone efflux protein